MLSAGWFTITLTTLSGNECGCKLVQDLDQRLRHSRRDSFSIESVKELFGSSPIYIIAVAQLST